MRAAQLGEVDLEFLPRNAEVGTVGVVDQEVGGATGGQAEAVVADDLDRSRPP